MRCVTLLHCSLLRCYCQPNRQLSLGNVASARLLSRQSPSVARSGSSIRFRTVARCWLFTAVSVHSIYVGSVIFGSERRISHSFESRFDALQNSTNLYSFLNQVIQKCKTLLGRPFCATDVYWAIVACNVIIYLGNRSPYGKLFMRYFANSPYGPTPATSMLLSVFSHYSPVHLLLNMYVLYSFTPTLIKMLGPEEYLSLFVAGGIFASLASLTNKAIRRSKFPSVGASGGICAILGAFCFLQPHARLCVPIVVNIYPHSFEARSAYSVLLLVESLATIFFPRSRIDHAAHMGGLLFGMFYSIGGMEGIRRRRDAVITFWRKCKRFLS